ncbi:MULTISPECIES: hypothetical protein [unclassified Leucobacter]|uniref:hypothetical protein n=1 Tax=unclassified Leucobacter TaxID=2621730 RepID=UPI000622154A|nr:hypothetical protein [Leucobacter sp. Ag1]KKI16501.1 hypothetical protein XM48_15125 [Leucobacter sp. Ag1]
MESTQEASRAAPVAATARSTIGVAVYGTTLVGVGAATVFLVYSFYAVPEDRWGIGWGFGLVWFPALLGSLLLGILIGLICWLGSRARRVGRGDTAAGSAERPLAIRTGLWSGGSVLAISCGPLLVEQLLQPSTAYGNHVGAFAPFFLAAVGAGLVGGIGTFALLPLIPVGAGGSERIRSVAALGAGLGTAIIGGMPTALALSFASSAGLDLAFGLGFPLVVLALFLLSAGFVRAQTRRKPPAPALRTG